VEDPAIRRERAQNLWSSFARKFPFVAKAVELDAAPEVGTDRIGGLETAQEEIFTYACGRTNPDVYASWGTVAPTGLLLIGEHGVGKTLLARALATRADTAFLRVSVPRLVLEIVHGGGGALGELLQTWSQTLDEMPPITVYFYELEFSQAEEIGAFRTDLPVPTIMDFLLDFVDRAIAVPAALLVASTTYPDTLRRAFIAPGRFERVVEVSPIFPDDVARAIAIHARDAEKRAGRKLFESVDWRAVVQQSEAPSPGDWIRLMHAVLRAKARCEVAGEPAGLVTEADLQAELDRFRRAQERLPSRRLGTYA
jgi:ATP-dependent 26S proteasome regulatory subunit